MSQRIRIWVISIIVIIAVVILALGRKAEAPATPSSNSAGLANPASTNCVQNLHGTLEIKSEPGGAVGYCHLPDGRVCEEWALMRSNTCNAPGASAASASLATTSQAMAGTWQSTDDTRYSLQLNADGTATERYQGDPKATATSTWKLFTSANPDTTFHGTITPGVIYVTLTSPSLTRHFSLVDVSTSSLQMVYLDRGGTLSFTRK